MPQVILEILKLFFTSWDRLCEIFFRKHIALILSILRVAYLLLEGEVDSASALATVLVGHRLELFTLGSMVLVGYFYVWRSARALTLAEIRSIPTCGYEEADLLVYSMRNQQDIIHRHQDYTNVIAKWGAEGCPNMTFSRPSSEGAPFAIRIKPATYKFLSKNREKIMALMDRSQTKAHFELKAGKGSFVVTMEQFDDTPAKFLDAVSTLMR
jgi:hypothetical protein